MKVACRVVLPIAFVGAWLLRVAEVEACSCMRAPGAQVALEGAEQVAVARVVEVAPSGPDAGSGSPAIPRLRVRLDIERSYKGDSVGSFEVFTATNSAACGYPFENGERYLVYAYRDTDGTLAVSLCSRTGRADQSGGDIAELDQLGPPEPKPPEEPNPDVSEAPNVDADQEGAVDPAEGSPPAPPRPATLAEPARAAKHPPSRRGCACSLPAQRADRTTSLVSMLPLLLWWRVRSRRVADLRKGA